MILFARKFCIVLLLVVSVLAAEGCSQDPVKEYGNEVLKARDRAGGTVDMANLRSLKSAVRMYHTQNGQYPESLEDIAGTLNTQLDLGKYDYDPETGAVTLRFR